MKSVTDTVSTIKFGLCGIPYFDNSVDDDKTNIDIAQEECAELIQALSKTKRYPDRDHHDKVAEELTHVLVCCVRIADIFGVTPSDVLKEVNRKREICIEQMKEGGAI